MGSFLCLNGGMGKEGAQEDSRTFIRKRGEDRNPKGRPQVSQHPQMGGTKEMTGASKQKVGQGADNQNNS